MRAIIRKWVAQIVTFSMLAGCVLPQGQTLWGGNNTLSQNSATAPESDDSWDGEIKLEIDPALMGEKYKHLKKVSFASDSEGEDFSIQSSRHYKNYKKYLKPEFQCVQSLPDGSFRAYFGYHNTNNNTLNIPIGSKNKILPAEPMLRWKHKKKKKFDQGQPTRFTPGRVGPFPNSAFSVDFDHGNVHWLLNGKTAKANKRSTRCPVGPTPTPQPTQTPSATPTPTLPPSPTPTPGGSPTPTPSVPPSPTPTPVPTNTPTPTPEPTEEPTPTPMPTPSDVVFDPADPSTLGDLYPDAPGNENSEVTHTSEIAMSINGSVPPQAAVGELLVHVAEPVQQNLQTILDDYKAGYIQLDTASSSGFYIIKPNLLTVNLDEFEANLRQLNGEIDNNEFKIHSASFGNLESVRTFALAVELLTNGLAKSVELNEIIKNQTAFNTTEDNLLDLRLSMPVPAPMPVSPVYANAENLWWLNEQSTNVIDAWNYSMGYNYRLNKPVEVAVIDAGFAGLTQLTIFQKDFANQILYKGYKVDLNADIDTSVGPPCLFLCSSVSLNYNGIMKSPVPFRFTELAAEDVLSCQATLTPCNSNSDTAYRSLLQNSFQVNNFPDSHGTQVATAIVAQANNNNGLVGVAPQSKVIPIKVGNGITIKNSEVIKALELIRDEPQLAEIDVVNISLGSGPDTFTQQILQKIARDRGSSPFVDTFNRVLQDLRARNVIVVLSAGNDGYRSSGNLYTLTNNALKVGALQLPPNNFYNNFANTLTPGTPSSLTRAIFGPATAVNTIDDYGSNWDSHPNSEQELIDIYAPGHQLLTHAVLTYQSPPLSSNDSRLGKSELNPSNGQISPIFINTVSGTSIAAPIISGIVALMKGINENIRLDEVRFILRDTAFTNQYGDNNTRTFPSSTPGVICRGQSNVNCGNVSNPSPLLTLKIANAKLALERVSGLYSIGNTQISSYYGTLLPDMTLILDNEPNTLILAYGTESHSSLSSIVNLFAEDPLGPILGGGARYNPINFYVGQRVRVDGYRLGNSLYFHQIKREQPIPPSTPSGLEAVQITTSDFIFRWSPSNGALSYNVFLNGSPYANTSTTSYLISGRAPGSTYNMQVQAVNSSGASSLSSILPVTTLPITPTPTPVCTNFVTEDINTDLSWQSLVNGSFSSVKQVTNPPFTSLIPLAIPIWTSLNTCPAPCTLQILKDYTLPTGWRIDNAQVTMQAADSAEVSVRGRSVGNASLNETQSSTKTFPIDPSFFGTGGNTLKLSFLAFNFFAINPAVEARFTIRRCQ